MRRRTVFKLISGGLASWLWPFNAGARTLAGSPVSGDSANLREAMNVALAGRPWIESDAVQLSVPVLAENGAIVPVTLSSSLPDTRRMMVFAERNPGPLLASFQLEPDAAGWLSLRFKLNDSGFVYGIVESGGRFYGSKKMVKVMVGGCS